MTSTKILHVSSSASGAGSTSRQLAEHLITRLANPQDLTVTERDLTDNVDLLTEKLVGANFTPVEERSPEQLNALAPGSSLIEELRSADTIVVSMPMYNFGPPAALKAWVDQIVRAGETFAYGNQGPTGLLSDRPVYVVVTSGGVPIGSEADFASGWIKAVFGLIGITSVTIIEAAGMAADPADAIARATSQIDNLDLLVTR